MHSLVVCRRPWAAVAAGSWAGAVRGWSACCRSPLRGHQAGRPQPCFCTARLCIQGMTRAMVCAQAWEVPPGTCMHAAQPSFKLYGTGSQRCSLLRVMEGLCFADPPRARTGWTREGAGRAHEGGANSGELRPPPHHPSAGRGPGPRRGQPQRPGHAPGTGRLPPRPHQVRASGVPQMPPISVRGGRSSRGHNIIWTGGGIPPL